MTLTTSPTTRPSSWTRTTSFDVGLDWRYPGRSQAVRVIECAELLAADLFTAAEQTRARITFGDVEPTWPSWPAIPRL